MIKYVIPARRNSKGYPFKNRELLFDTLDIIPEHARRDFIVTSDDEYILQTILDYDMGLLRRSEELSSDTASTKDVMLNVVDYFNLSKNDIIVMLYLTYPQRTWNEVQDALKLFITMGFRSLLCRKEVKTHPYLCIKENGQQLIKHSLYRRQDYPAIYEISHYISIFTVKELKKLNKNLYNKNTYWLKIDDKIDVDYKKDLYEACSRYTT